MHWLDRYHLKMILHYPFLGSIEFEGSTDDSQMKVKFKLGMKVTSLTCRPYTLFDISCHGNS